MKKFTLIAAVLLTCGLANAQDLGTGVLQEWPGEYQIYSPSITLQWSQDGVVQEVSIVNGTEVTDDPMYGTYTYATVNVTGPNSASYTAKVMNVYSWFMGGWDKTSIAITLNDPESDTDYFEWPFGSYTLTLPAGTVENEDNETNAEQTINWTLIEGSTFYVSDDQISPEVNKTYPSSDLAEVTISFNGAIKANPDCSPITYKDANDYSDEVAKELDSQYITVNTNKLVLNLSNLEEGQWFIYVPEGYLVYDEEDITGGIYIYYTIFEGMAEGEVLMGPAPAAQYANNVEITWNYQTIKAGTVDYTATITGSSNDEEVNITVPAENFELITVEEDNGGHNPDPTTRAVNESGNVLYINIADLLEGKTGNFELIIPANIVQNEEGLGNPRHTIEFSLQNLFDGETNVSIDGTVVTVAFDSDPDAYGYFLSDDTAGYLNTPSESKIEFDANWGGPVTVNGTTISYELEEYLTENGQYELVIPEGLFQFTYFDEDNNLVVYINAEVIYEFSYEDGTLTDVKRVNSIEDGVYRVYNLQGVKVLEGTSLNGLNSGLYIINGKKVIIRK